MVAGARPASCPCQAQLLRGRGDLRSKRGCFNVQLEKPSPLALQHAKASSRLGIDLQRNTAGDRLLVTSVDCHPRMKTPVAQWNTKEFRNANRGDGEEHRCHALQPGDRLCSINNVNGQTAMLTEMLASMSGASPKAVDLAISRNIADVMEPSDWSEPLQDRQEQELTAASPSQPAFGRPRFSTSLTNSSWTATQQSRSSSAGAWTSTPPQRTSGKPYSKPRPRPRRSSCSSRELSVCSTSASFFNSPWRKSAGSRASSSSPFDLDVALSNAGRAALAF